MSNPDYTVWHALHNDCPPGGCGRCVTIDVDWDEDLYKDLQRSAYFAGEDLDVYIHRAIVLGMKSES